MFPTTIHEVHTTECVKPQEAAKNTASADGFKWSDITCVADRKSNLLQYHENTRVITGAETVTKHLATHGCNYKSDTKSTGNLQQTLKVSTLISYTHCTEYIFRRLAPLKRKNRLEGYAQNETDNNHS